MILCPECYNVVAYNSWFGGYLCTCGWGKYMSVRDAWDEELGEPDNECEEQEHTERVKSGMANAKAKGKTLRHPKLRHKDIPQKFWKHYPDYKEKRMSLTDLAKIVGVSRPTVYRYVKCN